VKAVLAAPTVSTEINILAPLVTTAPPRHQIILHVLLGSILLKVMPYFSFIY